MPAPFSILALDLHNTVYDEVMEYGTALDEAVNFWLGIGNQLKREALYQELSAAHRQLGSDWDEDAWKFMPSLAQLGMSDIAFARAITQSQNLRYEKSKELTIKGVYKGLCETLSTLKRRGVRIYLITEAAADTAANAVNWLGLAGIIDGIYSWPSRKTPAALKGTFHSFFHSGEDGHLKKPHPYLLAILALDEAIRQGKLPAGTLPDEVFKIKNDEGAMPGPLLEIGDTPHAPALRKILESILYVGDSKFKDGMLARNAGVAFGHAAYGKHVPPEQAAAHRKSLEIMYAATGWDNDTIKLTQDAGQSDVINALQPDFIFEHGLSEALPLFKGGA